MVEYYSGLQVWDGHDIAKCFEDVYPFTLHGSVCDLQKSVCFYYKLLFLYNPYRLRFWGECTHCLDNCCTWNFQEGCQNKLEGECEQAFFNFLLLNGK